MNFKFFLIVNNKIQKMKKIKKQYKGLIQQKKIL